MTAIDLERDEDPGVGHVIVIVPVVGVERDVTGPGVETEIETDTETKKETEIETQRSETEIETKLEIKTSTMTSQLSQWWHR